MIICNALEQKNSNIFEIEEQIKTLLFFYLFKRIFLVIRYFFFSLEHNHIPPGKMKYFRMIYQ